MDINSALSELGSFGLYQLYVYLISCLPVINAGIVMLSLVFLTASPNHRCFVQNCDSIEINSQYYEPHIFYSIPKLLGFTSFESCKRYEQIEHFINQTKDKCDKSWFTNTTESCDSYIYDQKDFHSTVVTEFDIVCNNSWKLGLTQSVFYFGVLMGALCFGAFADRYGRRTVFMLAPILAFATSLISIFSPNLLIFTISSAITAACIAGQYQTAFIIGVEFIGGKWRVWCANIHSVLFAVGAVILCVMAYYVRDWRQLEFVISIPIALTLSYPWLFPESVRWQVSNGQSYKAIKTIEKAAKWNRVVIPHEYLYSTDESFIDPNSLQNDVKHYGPLDLLTHPITRFWTFNLFFIWFANSLVYYGLSFQASNIGTNIYVTFGWLAMAEIPAIIMATIAMQIFGRKKTLFFLLVMGGISCIAPIFVPESHRWVVTVLAVLGKSNISASFSLIYVYSVEIFPTVLRSSGLGMCSMSSRVGGILAPQLMIFTMFGESFPLLISGIISVIAGLLVVNLPETHNRQLPETLDDVQALRDGNKTDIKTQLSHGLIHLKNDTKDENKEERIKLLSDSEN